MGNPLVVPVDVERLVVDHLTPLLAARGEDLTVGVSVPSSWTQASRTHVQVALDGTPRQTWPVESSPTVRVTVWCARPTDGKRLAGLCQGLLAVHPGGGGIVSIRPLTGLLVARDPDTRAPLASVTVRVRTRFVPA